MADFFRKKGLWASILAIVCLLLLHTLLPLAETAHQCDEGHCTVCACLVQAEHTLEKAGAVPPSSPSPSPLPTQILFIGLVLTCMMTVRVRTPVTDWNRMNN